MELIFPRTNNDEIFNRGDTFGIKIVETNCFIRFGFFFCDLCRLLKTRILKLKINVRFLSGER